MIQRVFGIASKLYRALALHPLWPFYSRYQLSSAVAADRERRSCEPWSASDLYAAHKILSEAWMKRREATGGMNEPIENFLFHSMKHIEKETERALLALVKEPE